MSYALFLVVAGCCVSVCVVGRLLLRRMQFLNATEQLLVKELTSKVVINGPGRHFPSLWTTLSYKKRSAVTLKCAQHCVVFDEQTGGQRVVVGPKSFFLGPYEAEPLVEASTSLSENEALVVVDTSNGSRALLSGPRVWAPRTAFGGLVGLS